MRAVKLTRQYIRTSEYNQNWLDDLEAKVLSSARNDDDYRYPWDQGWWVTEVEILAQYPSPKNHRYPAHNQMQVVTALITETKTERVPEATEEDDGGR